MKKIIKATTIAILALTSFGATSQAFAAVGDQGVDWSKYNGYQGNFGYASDEFSIAQIGGTYGGYYVDQLTYNSQVQNTLAQGKRAHTYIWYQVGGSIELSKGVLDRYLPQIATPKGSIVALDYESGASGSKQANTDAILYGMSRVKEAGYTPMYYSYKPYTIANVDYKRIIKEFPGSLWIAEYPNYEVTPTPNWNFFPSMDDIGIFQFTSTYVAGGLDGNIDLTGITDNGYGGQVTPKPSTNLPFEGRSLEQLATDVQAGKFGQGAKLKKALGDYYVGVHAIVSEREKKVTVNESHGTLANQVQIGVYGINPDRPRLLGTYTDSVQELVNADAYKDSQKTRTYTVQAGDSLSSIGSKLGVSWQTLAVSNGISNPNLIYAGQSINY